MPLVYQAFNWSAGVYIGATMGSEMTAAAAGTVGKVRRDPMAMLPFCGYHMGDYFRHWIKMQKSLVGNAAHFPRELVPEGHRRSFPVAGLRRKHACAQVGGRSRPRPHAGQRDADRLDSLLRILEWKGWTTRKTTSTSLQAVDRDAWRRELIGHEELFIELHDHLPPEMVYERELLICRL
jgi:phosphoenolpyruvate carboxykinase (GTP)